MTAPSPAQAESFYPQAAPRPLPTHYEARRPTCDPLVQEARELDERLRLAASRKLFRVVEVSCAFADDGPAVFLLVPAYDYPRPAPIDAVPQPMPIPQSSPAQHLRVPESWIENRHQAST